MISRRAVLSKALLASLRSVAMTGGLIPVLSSVANAELFGRVPKDMPLDRSIYRLKGSVWVNGQLATLETFVSADSHIKTGPDSEIIFVVGEDAHILRSNSELQVEGQGRVESGLKVITGGLLSVFGRRKSSQVQMTTSTATIGIRGTGVYLESAETSSYICTCYGVADIQSQEGDAFERVSAVHHDAPRIVRKVPSGSVIEAAPLINHTDLELALIEALVGREPPFGNFTDRYGGIRRIY